MKPTNKIDDYSKLSRLFNDNDNDDKDHNEGGDCGGFKDNNDDNGYKDDNDDDNDDITFT